nr:dynamin-1-like [Macaca fascicularis]
MLRIHHMLKEVLTIIGDINKTTVSLPLSLHVDDSWLQVAQVQPRDAQPPPRPQPSLGCGPGFWASSCWVRPWGSATPYPPDQRLPLIPSALLARCSHAPLGITNTNHVPRANCVKKSMLQVAAVSSSTCGGMRIIMLRQETQNPGMAVEIQGGSGHRDAMLTADAAIGALC